jgi:branched-chain amino acid aminotransferase
MTSMTIPIRYLTPSGDLIQPPFVADSLDEVGTREPDGIYTITRTYHVNQVVMLDAHMDRLEQSAQLEGIDLDLNRSWLRSGLRRIIQQAGFPESRFRITIPRHDPRTALLAVEPLQLVSDEMRNNGVSAATVCIERPNPQAKSNRWIQQREMARNHLPEWAYEGLVCTDDGTILEGFLSNFYAVVNNTLRTAEKTVLSGIGRMILLKVAAGFIDVGHEPVMLDELPMITEALLTSSSRGVLPIVRIDRQVIGSGAPGPMTLELWHRYQNWVASHLEDI